jgi:hypothetical protein
MSVWQKNVEPGTYGLFKSKVERGLFYDNDGWSNFQWKENESGPWTYICTSVYITINIVLNIK